MDMNISMNMTLRGFDDPRPALLGRGSLDGRNSNGRRVGVVPPPAPTRPDISKPLTEEASLPRRGDA